MVPKDQESCLSKTNSVAGKGPRISKTMVAGEGLRTSKTNRLAGEGLASWEGFSLVFVFIMGFLFFTCTQTISLELLFKSQPFLANKSEKSLFPFPLPKK